MTIDTEKGIIWGTNGSACYYVNESGGLELTYIEDDGLTDQEFSEAEEELSKGR